MSSSEDLHTIEGPHNLVGLKSIFVHPFSLGLVFIPFGILSGHFEWSPMLTFWLNFCALIPLAKILGDGTEELAAALQNDALSGLLNATFGNAVEMIMTVVALQKNDFVLVKTSLMGSILSNCLLVLGASFLAGGFTPSASAQGADDFQSRRGCCVVDKEQRFPVRSALTSTGLLFLAITSFVLPSLFAEDACDAELKVSRIGSLLLITAYVAFLVYQLFTHSVTLMQEERAISDFHLDEGAEEDEEEEEAAGLSIWCSVLLMFGSALCISANSEYLVGSIEEVVTHFNIPMQFIGVILVPIVGNACEHAGAVRFAMRDKPALSIGIAVGSSTQIALLVVPFSVIVGWMMDKEMDLNFGQMHSMVMLMSALVLLAVLLDGRGTWLKGYLLIITYLFIAVLYWFLPLPQHQDPCTG
jgi:Ca2+:H+ antiporter